MKQLLKDSAQREQSMLKERGELREKVSILERLPMEGAVDGDIVQQLQQMR